MNDKLSALAGLLAGLCWAAPSACAQQATPVPPPKAPFVTLAPDGSQWSADIRYASGKKADSAAKGERRDTPSVPVKVERLVGRNKVQQNTTTYSDGRVEVCYLTGAYAFQKYGNSDKIAILQADSGGLDTLDSLRQASYPGTGWLSLKTYMGVATVGKDVCYHYVAGPAEKEFYSSDISIEAWIRVQDGYPLRVEFGATTYDFSPVTPFPQDVDLPPAYQDALKNLQAQLGPLWNQRRAKRR